MSTLYVKIDRLAKTAKISGPGTFESKDAIKQLGRARWNSAEKAWEVSAFVLSKEQIIGQFPDAIIEDMSGSDAAGFDFSGTTEAGSGVAPPAITPKIAGVPENISVSQLLSRVSATIEGAFPKTIFVRGILGTVKQPSPGRVFLDLAEEERRDEVVRCVIWRDAHLVCKGLIDAGFKLEPDLQVLFEVRVGFARKFGSISLEIVGVVAEYTLGKLAALREVTNERLRKEGLFAKNKALTLPMLPIRLGLLTSSSGTVINDFRAALDTARFGFELLWYPARVQGQGAKNDLIEGLRKLQQLEPDVILIFRGGGSASDLSIFNDYEVAKAVCLSAIPVISAIGHEEDHSSVQDVSCIALGVPKDVGRYFADMIRIYREKLAEYSNRIADCGFNQVSELQSRLLWLIQTIQIFPGHVLNNKLELCRRLAQEIPLRADFQIRQAERSLKQFLSGVVNGVEASIVLAEQRLELRHFLASLSESLLARWEKEVEHLRQLLEGAAPEVQLKRGYALIASEDGKYLTSGAQLAGGEQVQIQFHDVTRKAQIE